MARLRPYRSAAGFTLVEIIVASTIAGFVMIGILAMFVQAIRLTKYNTFRLEINGDMRRFTDELTTNATYANYSLIFTNFTTARSTGTGSSAVLNNVTDGYAGDFLLLVFKDPADDTKVSQLIGYIRDVNATTGVGVVRKFTTTISPSSAASIWTLIPATTTTTSNYTQILPDSNSQALGVGNSSTVTLSAGSTGIFYNYYNNSVIVRCQIKYSSTDGRTQQTMSTYNFTVSPRG
jgi:type II secretory pathway pseudopilin PulG